LQELHRMPHQGLLIAQYGDGTVIDMIDGAPEEF
jgi:hypothetical protein